MVLEQSRIPYSNIKPELSKIIANYDDASKMEYMSKWTMDPKDILVYIGAPGCGKTYFCCALINHLIENKKNFFYVTERDYFQGLRYCIQQNKDYNYDIKVYGQLDFLIFDDLGSSCSLSEPGNEMSEWRKEVLFSLLDERVISGKPTVFTSNFYINEMKRIFHPRFMSRLLAKKNTIVESTIDDLRQETLN